MNDLKLFGKRHEDCSHSPSFGKELSEAFEKRRKVNRALVTFKNLVDKLMHAVQSVRTKFWNGIDYRIMDNSLLAISILATNHYDNARRYNVFNHEVKHFSNNRISSLTFINQGTIISSSIIITICCHNAYGQQAIVHYLIINSIPKLPMEANDIEFNPVLKNITHIDS
ncbi:hypothetical protein V8G54_015709 [Vigna mungo]|uniref:Uncharacterized protein n=1 Tax=Vigna mungo TaxID=3915 RepID=A0AAQ3S0N7_VIGMU